MRKPSIVAQRRARKRTARRERYEALKSDPKRWAEHQAYMRSYRKMRLEKIKADPALLEAHRNETRATNELYREYRRIYYNERYRLDPQFRKKHAEYMAKYKTKLKTLGVERLSDQR